MRQTMKFLLSTTIALAISGIHICANVLTPGPNAHTSTFPGGDPRIQLCGKLSGDVTKADWTGTTEVKLVGCVPGARITSLSLCIRNCEGKTEALTAANGTLTVAMKKMISGLPAGTPFVMRVSVKDDKGRDWQVPDAAFVWKG